MKRLALLLATVMAGAANGQVPPSPRLSGIIVTPDQRSAIFAFDQDGVSQIAGEGMTVGSWTIVGIAEHEVEVATPAGRAIVVPDAMAPVAAPVLAAMPQPPTGDAMYLTRTP